MLQSHNKCLKVYLSKCYNICYKIILLFSSNQVSKTLLWQNKSSIVKMSQSSIFTGRLVGSPTIRKMCWLLRAHRLYDFLFGPVTSSHWLIRAVPLLFIPADPCCWLLGEVGTGLDLMSPIPRDEIKLSGAITSGQEGAREENTNPYRSVDDMVEKVRHWNRN